MAVPAKIIVEELLEDNSNKDKGISDYKFLCFNGKPVYVVYDKDRFSDHKRNFYDVN
ncbi:MAG: ATP-grasp fold amidoligase family protein [Mediterraneibacter gnavus]